MMTYYKFTDKAFDKLFNEFDQDKSGKINRQEMTTFIMRIMKTGASSVAQGGGAASTKRLKGASRVKKFKIPLQAQLMKNIGQSED